MSGEPPATEEPVGGAGSSLRALCVGASPALFREMARQVEDSGAELGRAPDEAAAVEALSLSRWDAVLAVLGEDPEGQLRGWDQLLRRLPTRPRLIAIVPAPSIPLTLKATSLGASEILSLPLAQEQLCAALHRMRLAASEVPLALPNAAPVAIGPYGFVSQSPAMLDACRRVAQVSASTASVLILGESGTGKELLARAIHQEGPRSSSPFVALNCAAIPENLLESELFGHEKGAFTGAVARKMGRFERAHGGTLLLDEIGDMSLPLQAKILRALQEREIERVGGTETVPVDVRLIAATNRDLVSMVRSRRFREDLYYRLAVVTIALPSLRERGDDLLLLTAFFVAEFEKQYGKHVSSITDRALALLRSHDWPGNVRELRNVVERAVLIAEGDTIRMEHLPEEWRAGPDGSVALEAGHALTLQEVERRHISAILTATGRQISQAARILGVHRNTLRRKMRAYDL